MLMHYVLFTFFTLIIYLLLSHLRSFFVFVFNVFFFEHTVIISLSLLYFTKHCFFCNIIFFLSRSMWFFLIINPKTMLHCSMCSTVSVFLYFFNWDSLHVRLNSHCKAWSYRKKKHKNIKAYRKIL